MTEKPKEEEHSCRNCPHPISDPVTLPCGNFIRAAFLERSKSFEEGLSDNHCLLCETEYQNSEFAEKSKSTVHETANGAPQTGMEIEAMERKYQPSSSTQGQEAKCEAVCKSVKYAADHSDCTEIELSDDLSKCRSRLTPVMLDIQAKIEFVDDQLAKTKEKAEAIKTANTHLKAKVKMVLEEMVELLRSYSTAGMEFLEAQLKPREELLESSVQTLSDFRRHLREAELQVNTVLKEQDEIRICKKIPEVEKIAASLIVDPQTVDANAGNEANINMTHLCEEMEHRNNDLRVQIGAAQRHLRNIFNPSEVTFDSETLHPCLVLSEDHKTVSFSVAKQPYPAGPQRFTNYFQALSSQSFSKGEHSWILQAECCPWVLGVCYGGLPRSGTESGLESRSGAWCLMWFDNLLRAYGGGKETPLKRTPFFQKLEIRLSFSKHCVTFSSISNVTGAKTHLYTFNVSFTEPVYLAVRMMSGQPKSQITLCT